MTTPPLPPQTPPTSQTPATPQTQRTPPTPPTPPALPQPTDVVDRLLLDAGAYLSCEECFERLDGYAESRVVGGPPAADLEAHLLACPACAEDVASLTALLQADAAPHRPGAGTQPSTGTRPGST